MNTKYPLTRRHATRSFAHAAEISEFKIVFREGEVKDFYMFGSSGFRLVLVIR